MADQIILGIDPGTTIMGYGVIKNNGSSMELLTIGVLKTSKLESHYEKLSKIFERTLSLIDEYNVHQLAIEAPFFGKNVQSMLKLGRAQGAAIAAALFRKIPITEYAPLRIKQAITGRGSASKEQVAYMLLHMFKLEAIPTYLDATDGLAAAVCHAMQLQNPLNTKKSDKRSHNSSWEEFIKSNPHRLK
ncbi:MAG: crossover junction endodeoxyribonuclease RuvC [Bacteroidales bacterium]|nr:crossover junction endodeoxyribonuclease RuvC [Bacteroidales bacterium]